MNSSELLDKLLERPALYVGQESLTLVKAFLDGYDLAKQSDNGWSRDALYTEFQQWVEERFRTNTSHNWAQIISFMGVSEAGAFRLMKELWGEYKAKVTANAEKSI